MLFHCSIDAEDPKRVAEVLAALFGGSAAPFPPIANGWLAMAGDDRATLIEIYPRGTILFEQEGDQDADGRIDEVACRIRGSATRFAMATQLTSDQVHAIAQREGWSAKYRRRGCMFGVIEMWLDNERMIEVLTAEMQAEYLAAMAPAASVATLAGAREMQAA